MTSAESSEFTVPASTIVRAMPACNWHVLTSLELAVPFTKHLHRTGVVPEFRGTIELVALKSALF